jgi:uncharacterized repeat protein (TIGR01451 family)/LPXTG-motif cell wall-anchored protein
LEESKTIGFGNYYDPPAETVSLVVYKFNDVNENGIFDNGEALLPNWQFTVSATGETNRVLSTDSTGYVTFTGLTPDTTYTVTETGKTHWYSSTPNPTTVSISLQDESKTIGFGNYYDPPGETVTLVVYKFNDVNRNGMLDDGEAFLPNWQFTVSATGETSRVLTTDSTGYVTFTGLTPNKIYTVTETGKPNWYSSTPNPTTVSINVELGSFTIRFGNYYDPPITIQDYPAITITKTGPATAEEEEVITYSFTVKNTGDVTLTNVQVTDPLFGGTWVYNIGTLGVNQEVSFTQAYTIPVGAAGTTIPNTATVTGNYGSTVVNSTSSHSVVVPRKTIIVDPDPPEAEEEVEPELPKTNALDLLYLALGAAAVTGGLAIRRKRK